MGARQVSNTRASLLELQNALLATRIADQLLEENLLGHDPYDALSSRFAGSQIRRSLGVLLVQLNRVSPIDFRAVLGIPERQDMKASAILGIALSVLLRLCETTNAQQLVHGKLAQCLRILELSRSTRSANYSLGTNRPIHMAAYQIDANEPCPFITLLAAEAFFRGHMCCGNGRYLELAKSAGSYFMDELDRDSISDKETYFHYMPGMKKRIYNLNALIGSFLVRLGDLIGDQELLNAGRSAIRYTVNRQNEDGSWYYGPQARYVDNYHTAFVLTALFEANRVLSDPEVRMSLSRGIAFYENNLVKRKGEFVIPLHFHWKRPPRNSNLLCKVDIRDCAMAIVLLSLLGEEQPRYGLLAKRVMDWCEKNMKNDTGYYYEKTWLWTNRIKYVSMQAYMAWALAVNLTQFCDFAAIADEDARRSRPCAS